MTGNEKSAVDGLGKSNFGFFHVFQSEFIRINFKH